MVAVESEKSHVRRKYVAFSILVVIDAKVDTAFESSIHDPLDCSLQLRLFASEMRWTIIKLN